MVEFFVILYIILSFYVIMYQLYRIITLIDICDKQNKILEDIYNCIQEVENENTK